MAKSTKKTLSQKVVNTATIGMPKPAKKFLGSRIVALLIVVSTPVLIGTGMITVKWENGRPRISINRERTTEIREEAKEQIEEYRESHGDGQPGVLADWQHEEELGERVAEQIDEAKEKWAGDDNRGWGNSTPKNPQSNHEKQAFRPFQGVGQKIKDLRR
jgi:hypothetical protein